MIDLKEGTTPKSIAELFGIHIKEIAILLIYGTDGEMNSTLAEDDVLLIFPLVGGG